MAAVAIAAAAPAADFAAADSSTNSPYADTGAWTIGDNGGEGFGAWRQTGDKTPNHAIDGNGFAVYHDGAIGRSLETAEGVSVSLPSGEFSVEALHGYTGSFSGFALYDADDAEILRWGVTTAEDGDNGIRTGFWYAIATGGQNVYRFVQRADAETLLRTRLDYSLTWGASDGGTAFALSAGAGGETWASAQVELEGTRAVSAIGVLAAGNSMSDTFRFDDLSVSGPLPSVPEPGSGALLALGAAILAACWRKRT
jgi:hypothetical protein